MIQEVEQRGAILRAQQFPSSNAVDIELSLYLVMRPLLATAHLGDELTERREVGKSDERWGSQW